MTKSNTPPRILLVGLGRFGWEHFETWKKLEKRGLAHLEGVVVGTPEHQRALAAKLSLPVYTGHGAERMAHVDAVDIVTPSETHAALVRQWLPHAHVLVEKPLATTFSDARALEALARQSRHLLMVNHLYRYHPAVIRLKRIIAGRAEVPKLIEITFTNPLEPGIERYSAHLELLHPFDILDYLLGPQGKVIFSRQQGNIHSVSLCFSSAKGNVTLGFEGSQRVRTLVVEYSKLRFSADLRDTAIVVKSREKLRRIQLPSDPMPLEASLQAFAGAVSRPQAAAVPDQTTGRRVVALALRGSAMSHRPRPRIAVIGGGIFGASAAIELAENCNVSLLERHSSLLSEATFHNQWRHHSGFHYPRSLETVREIQATREDFETAYGRTAIREITSYYCTSASGREITRERYIESCRMAGLDFAIADPPEGVLDKTQVDLCLRTDEGVFNYPEIRKIIEQKLRSFPTLETRLNADVIGAELAAGGRKVLRIRSGNRVRNEPFDYVINATYANTNLLATWLGLPLQRLRFDLCEMLVMELPLAPVSLTVLDGPFTSLVGTGEPGIFILSHIHESVLCSDVPADGLPPKWSGWRSNRANLLRQCSRYLPVLKDGRVLESRLATRTVQAFSEDYDGRPTVITDHGFGCWSLLGGKIVTSTSHARLLRQTIFPAVGASAAKAGGAPGGSSGPSPAGLPAELRPRKLAGIISSQKKY